jgi:hypothetical protein
MGLMVLTTRSFVTLWSILRLVAPTRHHLVARHGRHETAIRRSTQAPATDQTDDPAADAGLAAVAGVEMSSGELNQRLSRILGQADLQGEPVRRLWS